MQSAQHILMIRPVSFKPNDETADSNAFQKGLGQLTEHSALVKAQQEFDNMVNMLRSKGIDVTVVEDTKAPEKPDAIFPNNWISTHSNGSVFIYPMYTKNRREERRTDIINFLNDEYEVNEVFDISHYELDGKILEGTGSMVFDHINKIVYACASPRTNEGLLSFVADDLGYKHILFNALDTNKTPIYHTNVIMSIGTGYAIIAADTIQDKAQRTLVLASLKQGGHNIIEISLEQMNNFAGNMLEVRSLLGIIYLVMSKQAFDSLKPLQRKTIRQYAEIINPPLSTIEQIGGGSARCMMAEIFLRQK